MGLTERHWFEDEEPELTERQLQDAVEERETARIDIPEIETIKIKRQISMTATRCLVCGKWELPEFNDASYEPIIIEEKSGICKSCIKAIEWAKGQMEGR